MTTTRFDALRMKAICVALFAVYPVIAEAGIAGRVQFVAGDVSLRDAAGKASRLQKGQEVNEGDTVLSGPNGSAQLKMIDGAIVAVRPGTEVKVIDYVFNDAEDGKESASLSLVKGGLRAITGVIGRTNKDKVKIATPTATIGIRGTDHEPVVILPALAGAPTIAPPGTYDKVNVGATSLTTDAGTAVIAANQVGFAASPTQPPVLLPKMPEFYRATPAPTQDAQQEQKQEQAQSQSQEQKQEQQAADAPAQKTAAAAATTATTATTSTPATSLTAVDASGNTLNVASQTLTTSTGQTQTISGDTIITPPPPPPPVQTTNYSTVIASYPATIVSGDQSFSYPAVYSFEGPASSFSRDASGNLTGVTGSGSEHFGYISTLSQTGSTMTNLGQNTATGLSWGRWQGGQVTHSSQYLGVDSTGNVGMGAYNDQGVFVIGSTYSNSSALGSSSLHWIAGSSSAPEYLMRVLTGTATYSLIGGTNPTDQNGNVGTLNSAGLAVDFTNQLASANVNFSIGGNNWTMASNNMELFDTYFNSYTGCSDADCSGSLSITRNGTLVSSTATPTGTFAFGSMNGSLTGASLNGAALQYAVQEGGVVTDSNGGTTFTNNVIGGVAAFSGPAQDLNTPFRAVAAVDGWNAGGDLESELIEWDAPGVFRGSVDGGEAPASRVVLGTGGLTEFMGEAYGFTTTANTVADYDVAATIRIGTAANRDVGSATIGGATINWGRWEGGSIDIYSRDGSVKLGTIDNSGRSIHWLASPVLTNPTSFTALPLTGTATYTVAGNTSPTDFLGNVGTLTSATLNADFSATKVNAGINVSFNSPANTSSWTMTANNVPIKGSDGFQSGTLLNGLGGITHTASCTGSPCGAQTIGHIDGVFFSGGQGAVVSYGMATGSMTKEPGSTVFNPVNGVTGLVVMQK
ncbi:MAG TPA: FecR family protein [Noviherbaspirillum sp.]